MRVLGYDPYVGEEAVAALGIERRDLHGIYAESDFVSLHLPLTPDTRCMINADALRHFKQGSRLINCARGGLVNEVDLLAALESGQLAGAGLDVFSAEPPDDLTLVRHPKVVATPHLGASTVEAQERVGTEICDKIIEYLSEGTIMDAVNFPAVGREEYAAVRPVMELAEKLGRFAMQYAEGGRNHLDIRTQGSFVEMPMKPIAMAAAKGALSPTMERDVSLLNALSRAGERGWTVEDGRSNATSGFTGLLQLTLSGEGGSTTVAGTVYDGGHLRLVEIDGVPIDAEPEGVMICSKNHNVPGVVGQIGSLLGEAGVNIAGLRLGSMQGGEQALALITIDRPLDQAALESLQDIEEIISLRMIEI